jgi:hypothetical protein
MNCSWSLDGWYFRRQDSLLGPVTTRELEQLVADGALRSADTVWQGWKRAADRLLIPTVIRAVVSAETAPTRRRAS